MIASSRSLRKENDISVSLLHKVCVQARSGLLRRQVPCSFSAVTFCSYTVYARFSHYGLDLYAKHVVGSDCRSERYGLSPRYRQASPPCVRHNGVAQ